MSGLTEQQAKALAATGWWKGLPARDVATFQLFEDRLCMDVASFHKAVEEALGRSVWTHEFAFADRLRAEFLGDRTPPTFEEILDLIPHDKRVVVAIEGER